MLFKTLSLLKTTTAMQTMNNLGIRSFASKVYQDDKLHDSFNFPKHKEFFNDMYYQQEDSNPQTGSYGNNASGPKTAGDDFIDPNNPFI